MKYTATEKLKREDIPKPCRYARSLADTFNMHRAGHKVVLSEIRGGQAEVFAAGADGISQKIPAAWVRLPGLLHGLEAGPPYEPAYDWFRCECGENWIPYRKLGGITADLCYLCRECWAAMQEKMEQAHSQPHNFKPFLVEELIFDPTPQHHRNVYMAVEPQKILDYFRESKIDICGIRELPLEMEVEHDDGDSWGDATLDWIIRTAIGNSLGVEYFWPDDLHVVIDDDLAEMELGLPEHEIQRRLEAAGQQRLPGVATNPGDAA